VEPHPHQALSKSKIPEGSVWFFILPLKGNVFSNAASMGSCLEPRQSNNLLHACCLRNFREGDISNVVAVVVLVLPRATT